jgi:hypothetical protein
MVLIVVLLVTILIKSPLEEDEELHQEVMDMDHQVLVVLAVVL